MIVIITFKSKGEILVSHGVNTDTDSNICLPQIPLNQMSGVYFNKELGEYCLEEKA